MTPDYLKQSYFFFKSNFRTLISIQLPFILLLMLLQQTLVLSDAESSGLQHQLILLTGLDLLFVPIYLGATIRYMQSVVDGQPISALSSWLHGIRSWGRMFLTFLLSALIVSFGLMLLIAPGVYAAIRLVMANVICMLEGKGAIQSLQTSWEGTSSYFWLLLKGLAIIYGLLFTAEILMAPLVEAGSLLGLILSAALDFLNVFGTIFAFRIYRAWRDHEPDDAQDEAL